MSKVLTDKRGTKWRYRFQIASSDGKRKYESKSGFATQKEAYAEGVKAKAKYDSTGVIFHPKEMSFKDYLDYWIELYCEKNCSKTTIYSYQKRIRLYILPKLGKYSIHQLTPAALQEFMNNLVASGMSRNTITDIKGILSNSLSYAVLPLQYIESSPMIYVKVPKMKAVKSNTKNHIFVEADVWQKVIERFPEGHTSHIPLMIGYHCGLRLGEVFGLCWKDIDFENKTLKVERQVQMDNDTKKWRLVPPKYNSCRILDLDDEIIELLQREQQRRTDAKRYYKEFYCTLYENNGYIDSSGEPIDLIMVRENGTYIQPRTMQHVMRVVHGKANKTDPAISEKFDFHSLRHTHATMLFQAGIPLPAIQKRLDHANLNITEIYTDHVTEQMNTQLKTTLNKMF